MRLLLVLLPWHLGACAGGSDNPRARTEPPIGDLAVEAARATGVGDACGRVRPPEGSRPRRVLATGAGACYGCESVGFVARQLSRDALAEGGHLLVLSPAQDVDAVCEYLRAERVHAPVAAVQTTSLTREMQEAVTVIELDSTGHNGRAVHGSTVREFLRRRQSLSSAGEGPPKPGGRIRGSSLEPSALASSLGS
jgi:hypothetical protein